MILAKRASTTTAAATATATATRGGTGGSLRRIRPRNGLVCDIVVPVPSCACVSTSTSNNNMQTTQPHLVLQRLEQQRQYNVDAAFLLSRKSQIHTPHHPLYFVPCYHPLWGSERRRRNDDDDHHVDPHSFINWNGHNNNNNNNNNTTLNNNNNNNTRRFFSTKAVRQQKVARKEAPPNTKQAVLGETTTTTTMTMTSTAATTSSSLSLSSSSSSVVVPVLKKEKQQRDTQQQQQQQRKQSRRRQRQRQLRIQEIQSNSILHHHSNNNNTKTNNNNITSSFQLQTQADFGRLFDDMAVDYTLIWMDQIAKRIQEKIDWLLTQHVAETSSSSTSLIHNNNATVVGMMESSSIDENDNDDDNKNPLFFGTAVTQIVAVLLETTNPNDTLQIKILEQLLSIVTTSAPLLPVVVVTSSLQHQQQHQQLLLPLPPSREDYALATLLMTARELAVRLQQPLFWNKQDLHQRQEQQQQQQQQNDGDDLPTKQGGDDLLERRRLERHVMKSQEQLRDEALQLVLLLRTKLPKKYFKDVVTVFESYVGWNHTAAIVGASSGNNGIMGTAAIVVDNQQTNKIIKKKTLQKAYEPNLVASSDSDRISSSTNSTTSSTAKMTDHMAVRKKGHLPLRRLGKHLTRTARTHLFHVAEPIASFFYIIDKEGTDDNNNTINTTNKKKKAQQPSLVAADLPVVHSRNRWIKSRRFFIKTMMDVQEKMVDCIQKENDKTLECMQLQLDQNKLPGPLDNQLKKSKTIDKKKSPLVGDDDMMHLQVVAANQMEQELAESKKRLIDQTEQDSERKGPVGRPSRQFHVAHYVLDAMYVHEHGNYNTPAASIADIPLLLPSQSMVLIDNLPIDITREEVTHLYSRCGDLASVQLYNQRPDLDPGPLNKTQLELRRKSQSVLAGRRHRRQQMQRQNRHHFKSWHRPKTPVYAMLTFEESVGYNRASDDTLRIFGMMIQRHPARSIRPSELQSLFIEPFVVPYHDKNNDHGDDSNENSRLNENADREQRRTMIADLVYEVGQLMGPDFLVSLESGQHIHHTSQKVSMGSCEIKFPSFQVALDARETLIRELGILKGNTDNTINASSNPSPTGGAAAIGAKDSTHNVPMWTVNWLRTPRDALEWWTRKRGFDT